MANTIETWQNSNPGENVKTPEKQQISYQLKLELKAKN